jgi:hypothetical protein
MLVNLTRLPSYDQSYNLIIKYKIFAPEISFMETFFAFTCEIILTLRIFFSYTLL